jgi:hypothetical protein
MPNGCLEWIGHTGRKGYGSIRANGKNVKTHRLAWELANGPIPDGLHVLHHCDNPPCCETDPSEEYPEGHLFLGTNADNNADMMAKGRFVSGWALINPNAVKTHCPQGHEYTEANTYHYRNGRYCRACNSVYVARYKARRRSMKSDSRSTQ